MFGNQSHSSQGLEPVHYDFSKRENQSSPKLATNTGAHRQFDGPQYPFPSGEVLGDSSTTARGTPPPVIVANTASDNYILDIGSADPLPTRIVIRRGGAVISELQLSEVQHVPVANSGNGVYSGNRPLSTVGGGRLGQN